MNADEAILKRVSPHSQEAEQSVIGSMLMDKDAAVTACEMLEEEDFYESSFKLMFSAMRDMVSEDVPITLVTLRDRLEKDGAPEEIRDLSFIKGIMDLNPTSAYVKSYAGIVKEKSVLRKLIRMSEKVSENCYGGTESLDVILEEAEKGIFDLIKNKDRKEFVPIDEIAIEVMNKIEEASRLKEPITGVPSGFTDLDYMTTGFQPSDFILVAARPSMGKTAFVLNIMEYVALKKNLPCMIFSLEMSKEQLVKRMFAMDSGIDSQNLRSGKLTDDEWGRLVDTVGRVGKANLMIDDTPGITVTELRSKCRKAKLEHGLSLIIIDYLQLMTVSSKKADNRQQEISDISRSLKALARDLDCPVIALSQLSRACELRADHRPMLSDLRESGAIEQDADMVMFLYRDDYYNPDTEHPGEAEVIIAKQRNGPIGTITLNWQASTTKFVGKERVYS